MYRFSCQGARTLGCFAALFSISFVAGCQPGTPNAASVVPAASPGASAPSVAAAAPAAVVPAGPDFMGRCDGSGGIALDGQRIAVVSDEIAGNGQNQIAIYDAVKGGVPVTAPFDLNTLLGLPVDP